MKKKLASFVVDRRRMILAVMTVIAAVCAFWMTKVEINQDLTKYLPAKSEMKQGIDIMSEEFPDMQVSQTIRVMFDHLDPEEAGGILEKLKSIPYVTDVSFQADSPDYQRGDHTLFVIHSDAGYHSPEFKSIKKALDSDFKGYTMAWHDDDTGIPEVPAWILLSGVAAILLILLFMCSSWIEPILFLIGIGFAVVINQGTNIFQGRVSMVTASMASILQLVLSMDYSIILSNRYRQEKAKGGSNAEAMKAAVENAMPSVASSGMTTVAGLLMLLFMSFRIGMDLGVVLAKGVFLSMFCVLVLMPGILLSCDRLIQKTAKTAPRIPMKKLAAFSDRRHAAITAAFVLLMAGAFILQQQTGIVYTLQRDDPVAEVFPADNMLVLVYENRDEPAVPGLCESLRSDSRIKSVTSYYSALGTPYTAKEMAQNIPSMEGGLKLDESILSMIYYIRFAGDQPPAMTAPEFLSFLSEQVAGNEMFSDYIGEEQEQMISQAGDYAGLVSLLAGPDLLTPRQMAGLFSGVAPGLDETSLELLFLYRAGIENSDPEWKMTIEELFDVLYSTLRHDPRFAPLISEEAEALLSEAQASLTEGKKQLAGENYSRIILVTEYPDESPDTFRFIEQLNSACKEQFAGKVYLIGNSAMNYEMSLSFGGEYLFITLLTAAVIWLIVALTTKSLVIPLILVLIVQTSVFVTVSGIGLFGGSIFYLALLIVQCILMGATIDYGILFTNYYTEYRKTASRSDAIRQAYESAIHTIATSGLILVLVPSIIGRFFQDPTITAIVNTLSLGSLIAILIILVCLPGILVAVDRLMVNKSRNGKAR